MKFTGPILNKRWQLGPRMGAGSQARTYLARDRQSRAETTVVLKQFHLQNVDKNWKNFDLFEREVRVLKRVRHPGIPRFIDTFESEPGVFNLVMERMPGATLKAIATKVRFTDDELRDILVRVLDVLDALHRNDPPVIHRDVKPANLVRDVRGNISLVDFGGVRDALRESGGSTIVGTFGYMAPEQLHGQATPATDIYGLGATLVALAGKVEPEHVPRNGLRMDLKTHLKDRSPRLIEVLEAMTEPDPDHRPQTAREVLRLLEQPARRAAQAISPARDQAILDPVAPGNSVRPFDELGGMLDKLPAPLAFVVRISLLVFAIGGYVSVTVLQAVLLPVVFALIGGLTGEQRKPTLAATRRDINGALEEGKQGFRNLQDRCLPGSKRRKKLPKPK